MKILPFILAFVAVMIGKTANAGDEINKKSPTYQVGKPTQNVTPRYFKQTVRPSDGAVSTIYGNSVDENGKIQKPSGHGVRKDGEMTYSRTIGGKTLLDKK